MLTLQQYLAQNGIGATRLARLIGVDPSTASQIIGGRRVPSIRTLRAIAAMAPDVDLHLSISHYASNSTTDARSTPRRP